MHFIGCDVAKASLDLAYSSGAGKRRVVVKKVANTRRGWRQLVGWAEQQCSAPQQDIVVVLEATGVYHLKLAGHLTTLGFKVIVVNPGRAAQFANSLNQVNKSDGLDAWSLQRYGEQLVEPHWFTPDTPQISQLKALLSRLRQLNKDLQRERNRLEKCSFLAGSQLLSQSLRRGIKATTREAKRMQQAIDQLIASDADLQHNQNLLCTIKAIGAKTSQWLLPVLHTGRFNSARELAAFLGLTPCHKTSGTSLKAPGRLSGRGNAVLRAKLYMPALCAIQHNQEMKRFYEKLLARGKTKKQAITAVMRKLVHVCYGVINNQTPYIENYAT